MKIGIIGDFDGNRESHRALSASLQHSSHRLGVRIETLWLDSSSIPDLINNNVLNEFAGFWAAPGESYQNTQGALEGIRWARESRKPFIGTCQGFQHAALEYGVNMGGFRLKSGWESSGEILTPLLCLPYDSVSEFSITGKDNILYHAYRRQRFSERFRCRYGLNPDFEKKLSGVDWIAYDEGREAIAFQIKSHPFFLATLFQPHLSSTAQAPNPLIDEFLRACEDTGKNSGKHTTNG